MVSIETGLYVRIQQLDNGPHPHPLKNGFNTDTAYRVLGLHSASETSEAYLILSNDRDELWFISNRHARTVCILAESADFRFPLAQAEAVAVAGRKTCRCRMKSKE